MENLIDKVSVNRRARLEILFDDVAGNIKKALKEAPGKKPDSFPRRSSGGKSSFGFPGAFR